PRRGRASLRRQPEARHRAAWQARQRPRLLSLQLQRQRPDLCWRPRPRGAERAAGRSHARRRRILAGALRPARTEVPDLPAMDRIGRPRPRWRPDLLAMEDVMNIVPAFRIFRLSALALAAAAISIALATAAAAQQKFATADAAADALVAAARAGDR